MIAAVQELKSVLGPWPPCQALGRRAACRPVSRPRCAVRPWSGRCRDERREPVHHLLECAGEHAAAGHPEHRRFADTAPAAVHATLPDEGRYLGSVRTMYRLLNAQGGLRDRRRQLTHPAYAKPELLAIAPNQVWSWDITKLKGPA